MYKTYISGGLMIAGGIGWILYNGDVAKAVEMFAIGLGLIGLRHAIEKKE